MLTKAHYEANDSAREEVRFLLHPTIEMICCPITFVGVTIFCFWCLSLSGNDRKAEGPYS